MHLLLALLIALCSNAVLVHSAVYNDEVARTKFFPMACAAYSDSPERCVADTFTNYQFVGKYSVQCDLKRDTCFGFVAVDHDDKYVVVSFRGSTNAQVQVESNETFGEQPVPSLTGGRVNPYFYNGYSQLFDGGMKDAILKTKNQFPDYNVMVTGHSLGGAMASICAGALAKLGYVDKDKIQLVTFGQPRVGDRDYAKAIDSLLPFSFRVVHKQDIVPSNPPTILYNYYHHAAEVYYNNDMKRGQPYVTCNTDEGSQCSSGSLGTSWDDHHHYYDTSTDFARNGCKKM